MASHRPQLLLWDGHSVVSLGAVTRPRETSSDLDSSSESSSSQDCPRYVKLREKEHFEADLLDLPAVRKWSEWQRLVTNAPKGAWFHGDDDFKGPIAASIGIYELGFKAQGDKMTVVYLGKATGQPDLAKRLKTYIKNGTALVDQLEPYLRMDCELYVRWLRCSMVEEVHNKLEELLDAYDYPLNRVASRKHSTREPFYTAGQTSKMTLEKHRRKKMTGNVGRKEERILKEYSHADLVKLAALARDGKAIVKKQNARSSPKKEKRVKRMGRH